MSSRPPRRMPRQIHRFGVLRDLPPHTRALAESSEAGERAVDNVMAGLAANIGDAVREHAGHPLTEEDAAAIRERIRPLMDYTYGATRERAAESDMAQTITAEAQNARKRAAAVILATDVARHARRDPLIRSVTGLTSGDLAALEEIAE